MAFAAIFISSFSCWVRLLKMDSPIDAPSLVGMPTNTSSGISSNLWEAAIEKISLVFFTIALVMSLNDAAGPCSVPPMLSIICLETVFTYDEISSLGIIAFFVAAYFSMGRSPIFVVDHNGIAASPCSPPTQP